MERTKKMKITGEYITNALRAVSDPYELAAQCLPDLTVGQVKAILERRAYIRGDNVDGLEYIDKIKADER